MNIATRSKEDVQESNRKHDLAYKKYLKVSANRKQERFSVGIRRFVRNFDLRIKTN